MLGLLSDCPLQRSVGNCNKDIIVIIIIIIIIIIVARGGIGACIPVDVGKFFVHHCNW